MPEQTVEARAAELGTPVWNFWLPDDDRSCGWTNHGYVLQLVMRGTGNTADEAMAEAVDAGRVPDEFFPEPSLIATRDDAEQPVSMP